MAILVGEVGTYVEDILQAGMAGEDRQWAVVGEDKEMVDTQRNAPVELDMKEMEMEGRKQLAGKGLLMIVVGSYMAGHGMQLVLHKEVQSVHVLELVSAIPITKL